MSSSEVIGSSRLGRDLVVSSWCQGACPRVLRRVHSASGCCSANCRDVDVRNWKDKAVPGYLLCRAFLLCFCCLHLCFLHQWELVSPDLSVSRVWIIFSSTFLLQVQLLWFGRVDLTTVGHLTIYRWPSLSSGKAPPSCLLLYYVCLQMSFQTTRLAQVPSSH